MDGLCVPVRLWFLVLDPEPTLRLWGPAGGLTVCLQQGRGRARVAHAVVVIFLEFFAWGLLTTPMLTVSQPAGFECAGLSR